jgi:flagellar hook-associated protein FlgK
MLIQPINLELVSQVEMIGQLVSVEDEEVNNMVSSVDSINKAIQRVTVGQKQMAQ